MRAPTRRWLPLILLLAALGPAVEAATVWMYEVLVDEVLVPREFGLLHWVLLAYLALNLVEGVAWHFATTASRTGSGGASSSP